MNSKSENQEIGELLGEIIAANASVEIWESSKRGFIVAVRSRQLERFPVGINFKGKCINEALGLAVDWKRAKLGEASREEELAALIAADALHAAADPVEIGPDATCGCGSVRPLKVERSALMNVPWNGKPPTFEPVRLSNYPEAGEIGTCPDCGRNYTFGPS